MNKKYKILLPVLIIILGWVMIGIGFTIKTDPLINTSLFLSGLVVLIFGLIWFIRTISNK